MALNKLLWGEEYAVYDNTLPDVVSETRLSTAPAQFQQTVLRGMG